MATLVQESKKRTLKRGAENVAERSLFCVGVSYKFAGFHAISGTLIVVLAAGSAQLDVRLAEGRT